MLYISNTCRVFNIMCLVYSGIPVKCWVDAAKYSVFLLIWKEKKSTKIHRTWLLQFRYRNIFYYHWLCRTFGNKFNVFKQMNLFELFLPIFHMYCQPCRLCDMRCMCNIFTSVISWFSTVPMWRVLHCLPQNIVLMWDLSSITFNMRYMVCRTSWGVSGCSICSVWIT